MSFVGRVYVLLMFLQYNASITLLFHQSLFRHAAVYKNYNSWKIKNKQKSNAALQLTLERWNCSAYKKHLVQLSFKVRNNHVSKALSRSAGHMIALVSFVSTMTSMNKTMDEIRWEHSPKYGTVLQHSGPAFEHIILHFTTRYLYVFLLRSTVCNVHKDSTKKRKKAISMVGRMKWREIITSTVSRRHDWEPNSQSYCSRQIFTDPQEFHVQKETSRVLHELCVETFSL